VKLYLLFFVSIYGSPPSIMPEFETNKKINYVKFYSKDQCENYLIETATKKYKAMSIASSGSGLFLKNSKNTQFVVCKRFIEKNLLN